MLTARDIMTRELITVTPKTTIGEVANLLDSHRISGLPVVDRPGHLVGIITQSDLVERARDLELPPGINLLEIHVFLESPHHLMKRLEKMLGATVEQVMTPDPLTISPDAAIPEIAALMDRKKVHTFPVVENGKLVGIVGKIDIIRGLGLSRRQEG